MKTPRELVDLRAGQVASSLISEGYMLRTRYNFGAMPRVWFKMVHATNGNIITADITPMETRLWKNQKLIKSEPTAMRGV